MANNDLNSIVDFLGLLGYITTCKNTGDLKLVQIRINQYQFKFGCLCKQWCKTFNPFKSGCSSEGQYDFEYKWQNVWTSDLYNYTFEHKKAMYKEAAKLFKEVFKPEIKLPPPPPPSGRPHMPGYPTNMLPKIPDIPPDVGSLDDLIKERDEWNKKMNKVWNEMKEKCNNSCPKS